MTTRNDVHSPANLVPENYEYLFAGDNQSAWVLRGGEYALELSRKLGQSALDRHVHQCHHCGAHIRYFAILRHVPTGELIAVGETCLDRFDMTTNEFHALRKAAELDRQQQRIKKAVAAFVDANPDLAWMADKTLANVPEASAHNSFVFDVARKLRTYGELSQRQIDAVRNSLVRDAQWAADKAAKKAAEVAEVVAKVGTGRMDLKGEVLSIKVQSGYMPGTYDTKMLVKVTNLDGSVFKVWGSVPSNIEVEKGDVVRFVATVEPSRDDESFGFFKRPTKAEIVSTKTEEEN